LDRDVCHEFRGTANHHDHMFGMLVLGASACAQGLGPVVVHWISSH
jgi:hypothetical protein